MKIVYLYDGTPFIAEINEDGEYVYPNDEWTETPPPEGIYQPFYYDGNEWIGSTREEWLESLPKDEDNENDEGDVGDVDLNEIDLLNMQLITNDIQHSKDIKSLESDIANLTKLLLMSQRG